jgi:hypothetical protein
MEYREGTMKATRQEVYVAIDGERAYQDGQWPHGTKLGPELSVGDEILLAEQYLSLARAAWARQAAPEVDALDILRKVGGIVVRCMETHGVVER